MAEEKKVEKSLAAVLIRGLVGVRTDIRDALFSLRLRRKHACVLLPDTPQVRGTLVKCKDFIAYGSVSAETVKLLEKRKKGEHFALHPPRGGFERKGTKRAFSEGGALGDRGKHMDYLVKRMV